MWERQEPIFLLVNMFAILKMFCVSRFRDWFLCINCIFIHCLESHL
jgi:hypothetical protein